MNNLILILLAFLIAPVTIVPALYYFFNYLIYLNKNQKGKIKPHIRFGMISLGSIIITSFIFFTLYPQVIDLYKDLNAAPVYIVSPTLLLALISTLYILLAFLFFGVKSFQLKFDTFFENNKLAAAILAMYLAEIMVVYLTIVIYIPLFNIPI